MLEGAIRKEVSIQGERAQVGESKDKPSPSRLAHTRYSHILFPNWGELRTRADTQDQSSDQSCSASCSITQTRWERGLGLLRAKASGLTLWPMLSRIPMRSTPAQCLSTSFLLSVLGSEGSVTCITTPAHLHCVLKGFSQVYSSCLSQDTRYAIFPPCTPFFLFLLILLLSSPPSSTLCPCSPA